MQAAGAATGARAGLLLLLLPWLLVLSLMAVGVAAERGARAVQGYGLVERYVGSVDRQVVVRNAKAKFEPTDQDADTRTHAHASLK